MSAGSITPCDIESRLEEVQTLNQTRSVLERSERQERVSPNGGESYCGQAANSLENTPIDCIVALNMLVLSSYGFNLLSKEKKQCWSISF